MKLEFYNMWHRRLRPWIILAVAFVAFIELADNLHAQVDADWTKPFPPFRIAGNLYYVGSKGLANYLITTSQGHIRRTTITLPR